MYKYLFITLLIFAIFSCNSKKTEQELIYEAYREAKFGMTMEEVSVKMDVSIEDLTKLLNS